MHYVSQKLIYPELFSNAYFPKALFCIQLEMCSEVGGVLASLWLSLGIPNTIPGVGVRIRGRAKSCQKPALPGSYFPRQGQDGEIT